MPAGTVVVPVTVQRRRRARVDRRQRRAGHRAARAGAGGDGHDHAGTRRVDMLDRHHQGDVGIGVVVAANRLQLAGVRAEVDAGRAEVVGRGGRRVEDVEGVGHAVAVGVHAPARPGGRDELHGPDGVVVDGVAVEHAMVGVGDQCGALTI